MDYGELVDVKLKDVRQITENYLAIPFQAVECRLFNARENKEASAEEAKSFFEALYLCKDYNAKVM